MSPTTRMVDEAFKDEEDFDDVAIKVEPSDDAATIEQLLAVPLADRLALRALLTTMTMSDATSMRIRLRLEFFDPDYHDVFDFTSRIHRESIITTARDLAACIQLQLRGRAAS